MKQFFSNITTKIKNTDPRLMLSALLIAFTLLVVSIGLNVSKYVKNRKAKTTQTQTTSPSKTNNIIVAPPPGNTIVPRETDEIITADSSDKYKGVEPKYLPSKPVIPVQKKVIVKKKIIKKPKISTSTSTSVSGSSASASVTASAENISVSTSISGSSASARTSAN